jgi:hypothetical protein
MLQWIYIQGPSVILASDRQDKTVGDSNHEVKSKQSVSLLKHKSENMIILGGKSYPHDPGKVSKGENRKPHHISTPNKNHRRISCNPISASTYSNPQQNLCPTTTILHTITVA